MSESEVGEGRKRGREGEKERGRRREGRERGRRGVKEMERGREGREGPKRGREGGEEVWRKGERTDGTQL